MTNAWLQNADETVESFRNEMREVRRHLHSHPEPSGEEYATTRYLAQKLEGLNLQVRWGEDERGLIVDPPSDIAPHAPIVALRADIDALRIQDAKDVPYRSQVPHVMHACGHDSHSASVLGAVKALHSLQSAKALPLPVRWRAIFQPAEETNQGALAMIRAGALDDVKAILGLHMDPSRPVGRIGIRAGALTANCDGIDITVYGVGGHAARPHESVDPIAAAAQLISSIYLFIPRGVSAQEPVVVTIGQIHGGESANVVPEKVTLRGTMRSLDPDVRQQTKEHLHQLARGLAESSGTDIQVRFHEGPPAVMNDPGLTDLLRDTAAAVLEQSSVETIPHPSMGGEDFAQYLGRVPGALFRVGCVSPANAQPALLHSPYFDIEEEAMVVAAKILSRTTVQWFESQSKAPPL